MLRVGLCYCVAVLSPFSEVIAKNSTTPMIAGTNTRGVHTYFFPIITVITYYYYYYD